MVRQTLFALLAIAVIDLSFGGRAEAALPRYVQPPLMLSYNGTCNSNAFLCSSNGPLNFSYTVQSVSGNMVKVQTSSGGPFTCTDGSYCGTGFYQFWVDPANPVYYDKISGNKLTNLPSCPNDMICMAYSNSSGGGSTQINAQFDADSGLLVSYSYSVMRGPTGTGAPPEVTSIKFNIAAPYPLTVVETGPGSVSSAPGGINCGTTCAFNFPAGTPVTLTPTANAGASFAGWDGACSGSGACTVTMNSLAGVSASFGPSQTLTVNETGSGSGVVTSSPAGINCSATSNQCSAPFAGGSIVTLTASASSGSAFAGWSGGGCSGTASCAITLNAATTVTANFAAVAVTDTLSVQLGGTGSGTVTSSPSGISCGPTCNASFQPGTPVTLTAAAASGSTFVGWSSLACGVSTTCSLTVTADTTIGANFVQNNPPTVTLVASVLPASRSVQVGGVTATAYATIIDAGGGDASSCYLSPATSVPATFDFQTTNPTTNALTGTLNTPVNISQNGSQSFFFAMTPTAAFAPTDVALTFACGNAQPAATITGINTLNLSASVTPVPDIIALAASGDPGYVDIAGPTGTGVFAVATDNVGAASTIIASANTGMANLPIGLAVCQTDPMSGMCISATGSSVTTMIGANQTPTFGIFVSGNGTTVPDMPGMNRVYVQFTDAGGVLRGKTSVAVRTQ
jgi:Divergent InlB B-repeat domain